MGGIIESLTGIGATYNGPDVVSNEYDEEKQVWCMTFDDDITVLGDVDLSTMTVEGPFFITRSSYGLACNVETIILPETITRIEDLAFSGCSGLNSVTISGNVTSIGSMAFYYCTSLTSVMIPNSVTSIETSAFEECSSLTSITISGNVTSIGKGAFSKCTTLTSINVASDNSNYCSVDGVLFNNDRTTLIQCPGGKQGVYVIPNSVTSIENEAFRGCSSLISITIPNSITSIGSYAFQFCSSLNSVIIPDSITRIVDSAFEYCSGLTSVTIPNSITRIGYYVFAGCTSLTSVTIPNSVTSIGDHAFDDCSSLTSITCEAMTPPTLDGTYVFDDTNNCPIYVPANSVDAYKSAANWSEYASRIQAIQNS